MDNYVPGRFYETRCIFLLLDTFPDSLSITAVQSKTAKRCQNRAANPIVDVHISYLLIWSVTEKRNICKSAIATLYCLSYLVFTLATNRLIESSVKLSTIGSRAFPAAASSIWNSLPAYIVNASTLQSFQHHLKTFLFRRSFPDILL